jgi:hypothetical protein
VGINVDDYNHDGKLDISAGGLANNRFYSHTWLGNGNGTFGSDNREGKPHPERVGVNLGHAEPTDEGRHLRASRLVGAASAAGFFLRARRQRTRRLKPPLQHSMFGVQRSAIANSEMRTPNIERPTSNVALKADHPNIWCISLP